MLCEADCKKALGDLAAAQLVCDQLRKRGERRALFIVGQLRLQEGAANAEQVFDDYLAYFPDDLQARSDKLGISASSTDEHFMDNITTIKQKFGSSSYESINSIITFAIWLKGRGEFDKAHGQLSQITAKVSDHQGCRIRVHLALVAIARANTSGNPELVNAASDAVARIEPEKSPSEDLNRFATGLQGELLMLASSLLPIAPQN
jgi:hypothetical protein